jgi:hypothetical protein
MKKILSLLTLFVALVVSTANAQYNDRDTRDTRDQKTTRVFEPGVFQDDGGEYRWARVETRVWVPERRTTGIFGIGARTIPGHYEVTNTRLEKVYARSDRNSQTGDHKGREGKHPHGMPPGQRKKMQRNSDVYDDRRNDDRRDDDRRYDDRRDDDSRYDDRRDDDRRYDDRRDNDRNDSRGKKGKKK